MLGASITYRDDFDYRCLLPGFITSGTAYAVFGAFLGFDPLFGYIDAEYRFEKAWPLLWFVVIGLVAAAIGYLYAWIFTRRSGSPAGFRAERCSSPPRAVFWSGCWAW